MPSFTPSAGTYFYYVVTYTQVDGSYFVTDQAVWIKYSDVNLNVPPKIISTSISPTTISPSQSFTGHYEINNPTSYNMNVGLGLGIRPSGTNGEIVDTPHDVVISVAPGTNTYSRTFIVPSGASGGSYDVAQAIWSGQPGSSTQYATSGWKNTILTVQKDPDFSISITSPANYAHFLVEDSITFRASVQGGMTPIAMSGYQTLRVRLVEEIL